jgi:hypothetical protein
MAFILTIPADIKTAQTSTAPLSNLSPVHQAFFEAKAKKGLTFEQIGKEIGRDEVWVSSLFYAQVRQFHHAPSPKSLNLPFQ